MRFIRNLQRAIQHPARSSETDSGKNDTASSSSSETDSGKNETTKSSTQDDKKSENSQ